MPKFSIGGRLFVLDKNKAVKQQYDIVKYHYHRAVKAFVEAAAREVPIQTGMAKGTFLDAAEVTNAILTITPVISRAGRGPEEGRQQTLTQYREGRHDFKFVWATSVRHFLINEFNAMGYGPERKETPWEVLEAGFKAWEQEMNELRKRYPDILKGVLREVKIKT